MPHLVLATLNDPGARHAGRGRALRVHRRIPKAAAANLIGITAAALALALVRCRCRNRKARDDGGGGISMV